MINFRGNGGRDHLNTKFFDGHDNVSNLTELINFFGGKDIQNFTGKLHRKVQQYVYCTVFKFSEGSYRLGFNLHRTEEYI